MDTLVQEVQRSPLVWVAIFSLLFKLLQLLLRNLPRPAALDSNPCKAWKWRNLSVSLVHSMLTGVGAVTCVVQSSELMTNIHSSFSPHSYLLLCVSTGYFIQDVVDIILSGNTKGSWEFLLHHTLVIGCFMYAVLTRQYVGGTTVALFVEVNSVFLHTRIMLKLAGVQKTSHPYVLNRLLNILTYISFRLGAQFYITWYIFRNYSILEHGLYFLVSIMMMNIMILIYLYRLLRADFFPCQRPHNSLNNNSAKLAKD